MKTFRLLDYLIMILGYVVIVSSLAGGISMIANFGYNEGSLESAIIGYVIALVGTVLGGVLIGILYTNHEKPIDRGETEDENIQM